MWRELLIAISVASLVGLLALPYSHYEYWRSWAPKRFRFGFSVYLLLNGASGALGVLLAALLSWDPFPGKWALNAVVFAAAGQALLRVEPRGFGLDKLDAGRSILARGVDFVIDILNRGVDDRLERDLKSLDDAQLFDQAMYFCGKLIESDQGVPLETRQLIKAGVVASGQMLMGADRANGRGSLERFCFREVVDRRLTPLEAWVRAPGA